MKFTLEGGSEYNVIRSYSSEELRIGERTVRSSVHRHGRCAVSRIGRPRRWMSSRWSTQPIFEFARSLFCSAPALNSASAPAGIPRRLRRAWHGIEAMDLGAACRTFNILVQEERPRSPPCYF